MKRLLILIILTTLCIIARGKVTNALSLAELSKPSPSFITQTLEDISKEQEAVKQAEIARAAEQAKQADLQATIDNLKPIWTYRNVYTRLNCTAYVASRIQVPSDLHNAKNWGRGLLRYGWRSGDPRRGAIGVTTYGWAGHVVIAEQVEGNRVYISEYNFKRYRYSERWVSATDFKWYYQ